MFSPPFYNKSPTGRKLPGDIFAMESIRPKQLILKTAAFLFLSAPLAQAMPLSDGESWVWEVRESITDTLQTIRMARVIGVESTASGKIWKIAVEDSASQSRDTAQALELSDGAKYWLKASRLLPLEFQPWDGVEVDAKTPRDGGYMPWGQAFYGSNSQLSFTSSRGTEDWPFPVLRWEHPYWGSTISLPKFIWSDLGVVKAKFQLSSVWVLRLQNNSPVQQLVEHLSIPDSGSSFEWAELNSDYNIAAAKIVRWIVLGEQSDPYGGITVKISEEVDSLGATIRKGIVFRRLNAKTGKEFSPKDPWCPDPSDAWRSDIFDSIFPNGILRSDYSSEFQVGSHQSYSSSSDAYLEVIIQSTSDSTLCKYKGYRVLLMKNGVKIRNSLGTKVAIQSSKFSSDHTGFVGAARRYPETVVRWSDEQGKEGNEMCGRFLQSSSWMKNRVVFISATFPDGRSYRLKWAALRSSN